MLRYMLDTNIVIYTIKNRPPEIKQQFDAHLGHLCISTVTYSELAYGVEKSRDPHRNQQVVDGLVARLDVLPFDMAAASHLGQLRAELARMGRPIGHYDEMIAAHARSAGLIMVTNNLREFSRVPGLRLENWLVQVGT